MDDLNRKVCLIGELQNPHMCLDKARMIERT